jgi:hypothetical protein
MRAESEALFKRLKDSKTTVAFFPRAGKVESADKKVAK